MTSSMKRKTTIHLAPFSKWDPHNPNCQICNIVKLLQKGIIDTQKIKKKNTSGQNQVKHEYLTQFTLENLKEITQPDFTYKINLKELRP